MIAKQLIYDIKDLDPSIHYEDYTFGKGDYNLIDYTELPGETPYIPVAFKGSDEKWYKVTSIDISVICYFLKKLWILP